MFIENPTVPTQKQKIYTFCGGVEGLGDHSMLPLAVYSQGRSKILNSLIQKRHF